MQSPFGNRIIQVDRSGAGHNWQSIHPADIPENVMEQIAAEIIDGGKAECERYIATNGLCYRWRIVMTIASVQQRSNGGYYATIDGTEREFTESDGPTQNVCANCRKAEAWRNDECQRAVLCDTSGTILICTDCLETVRCRNW